MKLLLINPNTSVHITERLAASARAALGPGDTLTAVTAVDGPRVVRDAEQLAKAETSAMSLAVDHMANHDALVLGISLDGATHRLRELHPAVPVVGMTEAALFTACLTAGRIGLLTLGSSMLPLYRQRVEQVGVGSRVVGYEAPEVTAAFSAGAPLVAPAVLDVLVAACGRLRESGAEAVVLAGAVLCGYAERLTGLCEIPVFDGVACAVRQCRALLADRDASTGADERPYGARTASKQSHINQHQISRTPIEDATAMRRAIEASRDALEAGNNPYGAALVSADGRLLHVAANTETTSGDCTAHAEMVLVREAVARHGPAALRDGTVYASGEPCAMCSGALFWAGMRRVVYAAPSDAMADLLGGRLLPIRCAEVLADTSPSVQVDGPLLAEEALAVLRDAKARQRR